LHDLHQQHLESCANLVLQQVLGRVPSQVHPPLGDSEQRLPRPGVRFPLPGMPLSPCGPHATVHLLLREGPRARSQPALAGAQLRGGLREGPGLQAPLQRGLPPGAVPEVHRGWPAGALPLRPAGDRDDEVRRPAEVVLWRGLRQAAPMRPAQLPSPLPRGALPTLCREIEAVVLLRRHRGGAHLWPGGVQLWQAVRHAIRLWRARVRAGLPCGRLSGLPSRARTVG